MSEEKKIKWVKVIPWWKRLQTDRGGRAELKRARTPVEAALCPAFQRLVYDLGLTGEEASRLALAAVLLAWIKDNVEKDKKGDWPSFPAFVAQSGKVSDLRFRSLLEARDRQNLFTLLLRVLHLLDDRAPLVSLASDFFYWGDDVRQRWAYKYYGYSFAAAQGSDD